MLSFFMILYTVKLSYNLAINQGMDCLVDDPCIHVYTTYN